MNQPSSNRPLLLGTVALASCFLVSCGGSSVAGVAPQTITSYSVADRINWLFNESKTGIYTSGMVFVGSNAGGYQLFGSTGQNLTGPGAAFVVGGISSDLRIVGRSHILNGTGTVIAGRAFYWSSPTAAPVELAGRAGFDFATPRSVNAAGMVVGTLSNASGTPVNVYWPTAASAASDLTSPPSTIVTHIFDDGSIAFAEESGYGSIFVASSLAATRVKVICGLAGGKTVNLVRNDSKFVATEYVGPYLQGATAARPVIVNPGTGNGTVVPLPSGATTFVASTVNANSWIGGQQISPARAIVHRHGTSVFVDTLVSLPGVNLTNVVRIFNDGSMIVAGNEAGGQRHYYFPAGSF